MRSFLRSSVLRRSWRSAAAALLAGASLAALPAQAQETPPEGAKPDSAKTDADKPADGAAEKAADAPAAEPAKAEPGKGDGAPADATKPEPAVDKKKKPTSPDIMGDTGDQDLYGVSDDAVPPGARMEWAKRRDIKVIQKRAVVKEGRHSVSFLGGVVPNDDFWTYLTGGLGYNYYFSEDLALHVQGAYTYDQPTSLRAKLESNRPEGYELNVRLPQTLQGYATAGVDWNLMHGKFSFFGTGLNEFDAALSFGVGGVATRVTKKGVLEPAYRFDAAGSVGSYLQFYIADRWALRVNVHQLYYPAFDDVEGKATAGVSRPISFTLSLTWFTAPPE